MRKGGFYPRMALTNLLRSRRFYGPYLLTVVGTAAAFYIVNALAHAPDLPSSTRYAYLQMFMYMGIVVLGLFSVIFLLYTNSFLMKRRKKELGLYNVLGMGKRHIAAMLGFETLYTFLAGVGGGFLVGLLLQKLAALLLCRMMRLPSCFGFYVSWSSLGVTAAFFGAVLLVNLLLNLRRIHVQDPAQLLREGSAGEREPKTRWFTAALGVVTLGAGYAIALTTRTAAAALSLYFIAVALVIVGTYCMFSAVSIAVLKALRADRRYYYRTDHFIGVSGMLHRMKRNAEGLANICILSTMVLVMVSGTLALYLGSEETLDLQFPVELRAEAGYFPERGAFDEDAMSAALTGALERRGLSAEAMPSYRFLELFAAEEDGALEIRRFLSTASVSLCAMSAEDYAALTGAAAPELAAGQARMYRGGRPVQTDLTFRFPGGQTLSLSGQAGDEAYPAPRQFCQSALEVWYLVMNGDDLAALYDGQRAALEDSAKPMTWQGFWSVEGLTADGVEQTEEEVASADLGSWAFLNLETRESFGEEYYALNGGFFFLGVFLGLIFLMAAVLILYYKQISEGYEDRERYLVMQKVGMEPEMVRRSVNSQLRVVFFAPLLAAAVHVAFDFGLMTRLLMLFSLHNAMLTLWCTLGTLAVFAGVYALVYRATAGVYYKLVRW